MTPTYIDEATGSDATGDGSQNAPYKTVAYVLAQHDADATNQLELLVRKDGDTPYDKPSDSSLKKAKKGADGLRKKAAKATEVATREAKERTEADKRLEESRKIVLVEDETLPKAIKASSGLPDDTCAFELISTSTRHDRRRSTSWRACAGKGCVWRVGCTDCVSRRVLCLSCFAMVPDIFKQSSLANAYVE